MTANVLYLRESNLQAIEEMVRLFGLYTLSVREFAKTVMFELDLDLPDQRESATAQLRSTSDDLRERLAALTNPSLKEEP